jgi:hypothetical protein
MCTSWTNPTPWRLQLPESKVMTFQLLSKDGSSLDDAEVLSGRWQAYVEGFVSEAETPGVPVIKVRRPFLRRSVHNLVPPPPHSSLHQVSTFQGHGRGKTRLLRPRRPGDQGVRTDVPAVLRLTNRRRLMAYTFGRGTRAREYEARREERCPTALA